MAIQKVRGLGCTILATRELPLAYAKGFLLHRVKTLYRHSGLSQPHIRKKKGREVYKIIGSHPPLTEGDFPPMELNSCYE